MFSFIKEMSLIKITLKISMFSRMHSLISFKLAIYLITFYCIYDILKVSCMGRYWHAQESVQEVRAQKEMSISLLISWVVTFLRRPTLYARRNNIV